MDDESVQVVDVEDAGGAVMHNQMIVDGIQVSTFRKPPEVTAAIIRNIKNMKIRDDDVMLCSPMKSGTHWCFEVLSMLLNGTTEISAIQKLFLMLINVPEDELDKSESPRILNTHFPFKMLPLQMKEKKTKIILVLRNPKDMVTSLFYHHTGMSNYGYHGTFSNHLKLFIDGKVQYGDWFEYVLRFENAMNEEPDRIHLVFYEDLKENGIEEVKKIARFLGLPSEADDTFISAVNEQCSFDNMKEQKAYDDDLAKELFLDPSKFRMFRKGEIGDWKNHFTVAESEAFDSLLEEKMKSSKIKFRFEPRQM